MGGTKQKSRKLSTVKYFGVNLKNITQNHWKKHWKLETCIKKELRAQKGKIGLNLLVTRHSLWTFITRKLVSRHPFELFDQQLYIYAAFKFCVKMSVSVHIFVLWTYEIVKMCNIAIKKNVAAQSDQRNCKLLDISAFSSPPFQLITWQSNCNRRFLVFFFF